MVDRVGPLVTDALADKALDYMRDKAQETAEAIAHAEYLKEYRKSLKAILMSKAPSGTIAAIEAYAYAHPEYIAHLTATETAVAEAERLKFKMKAAAITVEVWRTECANSRVT